MKGGSGAGPIVAIDGPAGSGKSTVTRLLSERLGFTHIDTGALYRAVALLALERLGDLDAVESEQIEEIAKNAMLRFENHPDLKPANRIIIDGRDVTGEIRSEKVSRAASFVSAIAGVRAALLGLQRKLGRVGRTVLEGRDIGTVVFPDATVKFFLTASLTERAKRRRSQLQELASPGEKLPDIDELVKKIEARDHDDQSRNAAPLKKAEDAIEVDTSNLALDEVVSKLEQLIRDRI